MMTVTTITYKELNKMDGSKLFSTASSYSKNGGRNFQSSSDFNITNLGLFYGNSSYVSFLSPEIFKTALFGLLLTIVNSILC